MTENTERPNPPPSGESQVSRRGLLKKMRNLAVGAVAAATVGNLPSSPSTEFNPDTSSLREEIERQFNIKLRTLKEFNTIEFNIWSEREIDTLKPPWWDQPPWTKQELELLSETLADLPPHFYAPDKNGNPLMVILQPRSERGGNCTCGRKDHSYPNSITIGLAHARNNSLPFKIDKVQIIIHELTHMITPMLGDRISYSSAWDDYMDQILGVRFPDAQKELLKKAVDKLSPLTQDGSIGSISIGSILGSESIIKRNLPKEEEMKASVYDRITYGVGSSLAARNGKPFEFIADLATHYRILGKDNFTKIYSEFFNPEVVEGLYNFVRDDIFRGKEYAPLPLTYK